VTDTIVPLLLGGAIRKNKGRGLVFFAALQKANTEQLRKALAILNGKRAKYNYGCHGLRRAAIEQRLLELAAQEGTR